MSSPDRNDFARAASYPELLDKLAARCGIEPEFWDITGQIRKTSTETKCLLLEAMGVAARDPLQAACSLAELEREQWTEGLPPVSVVRINDAVSVDIVLPAQSPGLTWHLKLENGAVREAEGRRQDLPLVATNSASSGTLEKRKLQLGADLPIGYHSLKVTPGEHEMTLIITPGQCWLPADVAGGKRLWGLSCQLYLLRSASNWGIGDFSDLQRLLEIVASCGAQLVGINPIHSMFIAHPEHASPYSPSHRALLNVLYIDVMAIPEFGKCRRTREWVESREFKRIMQECRGKRYVDYATAGSLKLHALRLLFAEWQSGAQAHRRESFHNFKQTRGELLKRASIFEALCAEFNSGDQHLPNWRNWPEKYRTPTSPDVEMFATSHATQVEFYSWLQWIADEQLKNATSGASALKIGLYGDLAVGSHPEGAEPWSDQYTMAAGVSIGAPPDPFSQEGQNWGLPPYNPRALRSSRYRSFIELIRANMRYRGALRIDHAMALQHLYWVPDGHSATEGAYVSYPLEDLLGILALESHRNECLIIAEDLGTVPEGFRRRIQEANILSYRVLLFERKWGTNAFITPGEYPRLSIAVASNHDLPTLRAWWEGADLELKRKIGLIPTQEQLEHEHRQREQDRIQLLEALCAEGLIAAGQSPDSEAILNAVHEYLSRTASVLALAQLDDVCRETEPVNIPGTVEQYANWRRRLSITLEELSKSGALAGLTAIFAKRRNGS
jgi:4-alpha-glucanotransferase